MSEKTKDILRQRWFKDRRVYDRARGKYIDLVPRVYRGHQYVGVVRGMRVNSENLCGGRKKAVFNFSSKSKKAMFMKLDSLFDVFRPNFFLTLTYPADFPMDGRVCKDHLVKLFQFLVGRGNFAGVDSTVKFFWKMEFQERGAVHFHILVESALSLEALRSAVVGKWRKLTGNDYEWGGVDLSVLRDDFRSKLYTALYSHKRHQNTVPEGFLHAGRFWGTMGIPKLVPPLLSPSPGTSPDGPSGGVAPDTSASSPETLILSTNYDCSILSFSPYQLSFRNSSTAAA
jgi:hypothetical protein